MTSTGPTPWPANAQPNPPGALIYGIGIKQLVVDDDGNPVLGDRGQTSHQWVWIAKPGCWGEVWRTYERVSNTDVSTAKVRAWFPYDVDTVRMDEYSRFAIPATVDDSGAIVLAPNRAGEMVPVGATVYEVEGPPHVVVDDDWGDLTHIECQGTYSSG